MFALLLLSSCSFSVSFCEAYMRPPRLLKLSHLSSLSTRHVWVVTNHQTNIKTANESETSRFSFSVRRTKTFQSFYNTVTAASVFQTHLNTCISPEAARAHTGKYTQSNASSSVKNEYVSKSHVLVFRGTFALWCSCILSLSDRTPWFCLISKVFQIWSNHT